jgi:DNA-binding beta-propeller fold protein YncE
VWVTDNNTGTLLKLNSAGAILQTVTVGSGPAFPVFDGTNIWVPNQSSNSVSVVRASSGAVLQTFTGNGLFNPLTAAFDGQRVLVTNASGHTVSLWKAADLTPLGSFEMGSSTSPFGACSDGINFWIR